MRSCRMLLLIFRSCVQIVSKAMGLHDGADWTLLIADFSPRGSPEPSLYPRGKAKPLGRAIWYKRAKLQSVSTRKSA